MAVICEECGKVYYIDPGKVEQYRDRNIRLRCSECGHATELSRLFDTYKKPRPYTEDEKLRHKAAPSEESLYSGAAGEDESVYVAPEELGLSPVEAEPGDAGFADGGSYPVPESSGDHASRGWIGLRGKMFFLFFLIPAAFLVASGYFSQMRLEETVSKITNQSADIVADSGQGRVLQKAKDVALQCEIYLRFNPYRQREDFSYDPEFNRIAVQQFGETGYTCLIQEPEEGQGWTIWAHTNPNLIGIDDIDTLRKALGQQFEEFFSIVKASKGRKISTGHYMWKDNKGNLRKKYMAVAPIKIEGKPFSVIASVYMNEFTEKIEELGKDAEQIAADTRNISMGLLGCAIAAIGLCILIYGHRLSRNIDSLTDAAERISAGDLEAEIEVRANDQIGHLAEAVSRIQDRMRLFVERLQRNI
ncbi:MAG: HAMP domain-containing protein [Desulfobacteraceae bacterium]|nr:HAMP domain-containing protein [Desulfobacteraceae bacterium]